MTKVKQNGKVVIGGVIAIMIVFGFVFLTGGFERFINGNIQTFSLTQDNRSLTCEMWNAIAVTREGGLKVQLDSSRMEGFIPFIDSSQLSFTADGFNIEQMHFQLWATCNGSLMKEANAVNIGGQVETLICGDPASSTTSCLVGNDRLFEGDLRNAEDFVTLNIPQKTLPDDTTIMVAEWSLSNEELELHYLSSDGKIFFTSKMFPTWIITINHPDLGVFTANYNSAQQNDPIFAQYGELRSTSTEQSDTDFDGDGINDADDLCPTQPETVNGFQDLDGCPDTVTDPDMDTDGDGINDNDDACDFEPEDGLQPFPFDGCPADSDSCPNLQVLVNGQCFPDSDNDGIPDNQDNCPVDAGLAENNGCPPDDPKIDDPIPEPDTDGDGIPDNEDSCPTQGGIVDSTGCPVSCPDNQTWSILFQLCVFVDLPPPDCETNPTLVECQVECTEGGETCTKDDDDTDGDGIPNDQDLCANEPEDFDGVEDEDGCPESEISAPPDTIVDFPEVIRDIQDSVKDPNTQLIIFLILGAMIGIIILTRIKKFKFKR